MSIYLQRKIEETRTRLEALQQELFSLRGELRAYEDALRHERSAVPTAGPPDRASAVSSTEAEKPKPEQPGHWPKLIESLAARKEQFTTDDVMGELTKLGKTVSRKSVRSKMVDLVKQGVVVRISDGTFRVPLKGVSGNDLRRMGIIPQHAKLIGEP